MPFPPSTAGRKLRVTSQPTVAIGRATAEATGNALETGGNLAAVLAKLSADPATQTTLAAILAKIIAAPATSAKQDTLITAIAGLQTSLDTAIGHLAAIELNTDRIP